MKRIALLCLCLAPGLNGLMCSPSRAQDPAEVLKHFRLLPRLSRMFTTGHEGPDMIHQLGGIYDLRHDRVWPIEASFENADVWGVQLWPQPSPPIVFDIDELLNLEGLRGEALPVMAPFDVFHFEGKASDGSSVDLFAAMLGTWMYVRGGTEPPPDIMDFPTRRVQWLAHSRPFADLNGDAVVDTADYVLIRRAVARGFRAGDEYDGTAGIGLADWLQQFGEAAPDVSALDSMMSSALASMTTAAAPEPGSVGLALFGAVLIANVRRRGSSRRCGRSFTGGSVDTATLTPATQLTH